MTLSQRLTRAGLTFIVLGTVATLVPTNGVANAATTTCAQNGNTYTLGTSPNEATATYPLNGASLTLNTYVNTTQTAASITASDSINFTNTISPSSITITRNNPGPASETVSAAFVSGPTVVATVTSP